MHECDVRLVTVVSKYFNFATFSKGLSECLHLYNDFVLVTRHHHIIIIVDFEETGYESVLDSTDAG
jgi:hypothetical protein